jgi:hypothetical protein
MINFNNNFYFDITQYENPYQLISYKRGIKNVW